MYSVIEHHKISPESYKIDILFNRVSAEDCGESGCVEVDEVRSFAGKAEDRAARGCV